MARGIEGNEVSTPRPPTLKKSTSSSQPEKNQKTLFGFFQKSSQTPPVASQSSDTSTKGVPKPSKAKAKRNGSHAGFNANLTPASSSDAPEAPSPETALPHHDKKGLIEDQENGLPSPITPAEVKADAVLSKDNVASSFYSPSRKAKKAVNYAESENSEGDDDDDVFKPLPNNTTNGRASKRRKVSIEESEDEYDMDNFVVADDSDDEPVKPKKRKRDPSGPSQKKSKGPSPPAAPGSSDDDLELPTVSTAQQWTYDAENPLPHEARKAPPPTQKPAGEKKKQKAHMSEPEQRYTWLAKIQDADRNEPGHPDYDPRTIYIPPLAWNNFSPFEKQYWEIKQKFWDTIVFFKKGKFYELYENDATIGHQLFDLKLTDRVNMRMVGVPEASLDQWANQFVAKGFKIARVDQMESALAKEMRERGVQNPGKKQKEDKVIRRELSSVLTAGTLVEGSMLQDDMSTYCVAIKEVDRDNRPAFGIAFVDTATAQFHLAEFIDDMDMTRFETFVAQTRPGELLLEKSCISAKALRILKNNTGPTTIWNYLKPGKEFWPADITCREIDASGYFVSQDQANEEAWPQVLREAREKDLVMSAVGALIQYLRLLKIERDLVSLGNFSWYDPIRKATSLVLDGQSLINLEIFANSVDGGTEGTLFAMLNRCVTPFGKRMLRQWVCHPLADADKINARLDAVEALNADSSVTDRFTSSLTKIPDLERLISRVHAGRCKAQDFIKVLEGFEQIEYTMSLVGAVGAGEGLIGQLIASMPDLSGSLKSWKDAFDRRKAKDEGILVPEPGVEADFDESQGSIEACLKDLDNLLKKARRDLGSTAIKFTDNGKEIYQLEVPIKVAGIPKSWDQMSATKQVKRYYSPELRKLVRALQEAQETHGQIVKEVASRFYARFDEDYSTWLTAVKIVAQLDCLISLAKASASLGSPSCRPVFVDSPRSVLEFTSLRHPCMLNTVTDFIPNDIRLGGSDPNLTLLTGANAAGKSTILRMTCVAAILAQVGCHVPAEAATLTPLDRIMSRLGAHDLLFAAQSTFFVELAQTARILAEATPRSLVILDELGRGTSSGDGLAVAQAVLHEVASHRGCLGFFATHYHSLALEFAAHPEVAARRMRIHVDEAQRQITFLYKLEDGVAEGSFGMHCAAMCGIPGRVIEKAEQAAREWEHTSRVRESLEKAQQACYLPLGMLSDVAWLLKDGGEAGVEDRGLDVLQRAIEKL
ncbi:MAG: DNA mismatch repair protein msh6 [Bathelium mastoideum]|nr:MAG: DNA mismatch repair protein msh6 [Bathelium mastoideum]KAI9689060.1 MAG: DNA mismatch repair protein msh6 [Bathelium mastoideum]